MIELVKSPVVFYEEPHTYMLGDRQLHGITGMLHRQLFTDKYKDVPAFVLERARVKGSLIHSQCQFADATEMPESDEAIQYLALRKNSGYDALENEYTVSDEEYFASNIDCVWCKGDKIALADIKTTYTLDKEYLSWQLSIYAYLFEKQNNIPVEELFGIWIRNGKVEIYDIERKPTEEVVKLMQCEINGTQYVSDEHPTVVENQILKPSALDDIREIIELEKYYAAKKKEMSQKILDLMKANNIKSWDAEVLKMTYVAPTESTSFDSKKFEQEHPDLYKQYLKTTKKTDSVKITLR